MATKMSPLKGTFASGGWHFADGWDGHASPERARRRRKNQMAHKSRKINQKVARG